MELTQRLECTQELNPKCSEKEFPDQIGFLGICGQKYPLKKGPNKIGRDPDTCNIILNLNSISRQHAVINILSSHEFMLMDLDSANKTKICDKTLQAYIPHSLKNGDMVQFGQVFGVFRLFEEDNDLPMTQALDVPETPVQNRHISKLNNVHVTTIPESPDVSDRDDSFVAPSQPKPKNVYKSPNKNFIKTSGKTISIKPVGTNKIDNVYWSSSKKSDSFSLQSDVSSNDISLQIESNKPDIHELDTQVTNNCNESNDSIYNANTQCIMNPPSPTIHNMETQVPTDLPEVCKIEEQHDVHFNFTTENKENDNNIFNAETQGEHVPKQSTSNKNITDETITKPLSTKSTKDLDTSDDIILFDEIDSHPLEDNIESQALIPPEFNIISDNQETPEDNKDSQEVKGTRSSKRVCRLVSDSSTDCEDDINVAMTQKISAINNDDTTDCEDEPEVTKSTEKEKKADIDDDVTDCEDDDSNLIPPNKQNINEMEIQVIEKDTKIVNVTNDGKNEINFEDLSTQIIEQDKNDSKDEGTVFEDLPTQIIEEEPINVGIEDALTQQIYSEEIVTPFKVPKLSLKGKKKDSRFKGLNEMVNNPVSNSNDNIDVDEELYYAATQDIFQDLCSQRELSPEIVKIPKTQNISKSLEGNKNSAVKNVTPNPFGRDSSDDIDIDEKIDNFVYNLSNSQIMNVVGVNKTSSSSSDPELTPKKINPVTILNTKLPNTDEIKKSLSFSGNAELDALSESDSGNSVQSPIKVRIVRKEPTKSRIDLTKKFEVDMIPTRVITRARKPTSKMRDSDDSTRSLCENILKSKFISDKNGKESVRKADDIESQKERPSRSKIKSDQSVKKNDTKDSSKEHDQTKEKRKSDKETRRRRKDKNKDESEKSDTKQTVAKSNKEKVTKDMLYYLDKTSRHTRSRSNQKADTNEKKQLEGKEKELESKERGLESKEKRQTEDKVSERKSSRSRTKAAQKRESPEKEVRRSKRQKSSKKSEDITKIDTKSKAKVSKDSHEQSTVYNTSSDTADPQNKLKRSLTENFEAPSAKKSKTESNSKNMSLRATPARKVKTHYVLFTAFPCDEVKVKLEKLGAIIVSDVMKCTVVLTMQIKRTFKLLCAVGLGKPIVGPTWVQACADTNMIVDPWLYLIKDEATERRFQFNLERSLATRRNFLKGYNIYSTPSVLPNAQEMKLIVECSGGTWKNEGPNWICVSASQDKGLWPALKRKGAIIVSTEFILAGVLRQRVEIDKNRLD